MNNNQITLLQDGDHSFSDNYKFAFSHDSVDAMAKANVKHFFCEYMADPHQKCIDDFISGKMSEADFKNVMMEYDKEQPENLRRETVDAFTDFVKYADSKGIKIHAIDEHGKVMCFGECMMSHLRPDDDMTYKEIVENLEAMKTKEKKPDLKKMYEDAISYAKEFKPEMKFADSMPKVQYDASAERANEDKFRADKIINIAGKDKSVIMYGELHGSLRDGSGGKYDRDLDEYLGNCAKILLSPNKASYDKAKSMGFKETAATIIFTNDSVSYQINDKEHAPGSEISGRPDIDKYRPLTENDLQVTVKPGDLSPSTNNDRSAPLPPR